MIAAAHNLRACVAAALSTLPACLAAADGPAVLDGLSAGTIAVISDGDFVAGSYATGRLAPPDAGYRDTLTILSATDGGFTSREIPVSNSVTAPPEVLDVAADGAVAFVTERLGQRPAGATAIADLPAGNRLFAIDLTDTSNRRPVAVADVSPVPESVAASPDGARVAVVSNTSDASVIEIVRYEEGAFGDVERFDLADLGITGQDGRPRGGVTVSAVNWHPTGRYLAVNLNTQDRVVFFAVVDDDGRTELQPWGNVVTVGRDPFVGRFTPDGRYYLTSDWGRNFDATTLEGRLPEDPSSISVVRLAPAGTAGADARHERIGGAPTDLSAEGIAVSPDGRLVATVNMRGTPFPPGSPRFDRQASVTLLSFDPETGAIAKVDDYPLDGALPEGGTFDLTGEHFLATVFQGHTGAGPDSGSGLEVFRVVSGERPALERIGRVSMPHGAHHVDVAR